MRRFDTNSKQTLGKLRIRGEAAPLVKDFVVIVHQRCRNSPEYAAKGRETRELFDQLSFNSFGQVKKQSKCHEHEHGDCVQQRNLSSASRSGSAHVRLHE